MTGFIRLIDRIPVVGRYVVLVFQRHLDLQAAVELVASELEYNAEAVSHDRALADLWNEVQFSAWDAHRQQVLVALRRDSDGQRVVIDSYDGLRRLQRGAHPPTAEALNAAAARLRNLN